MMSFFHAVGPDSVSITGNAKTYVADDSTSLVLTCTTSTVSYGTNYTIHWENGTESKVSILAAIIIKPRQ